MAAVGVFLNGKDCWPDIAKRPKIDLLGTDAPPVQLALMTGGMTSGESSLVIRLDLPDGQVVLTEVPLPGFLEAAKSLQLAEAAYRRAVRDRRQGVI
jgi:hypothetical protein